LYFTFFYKLKLLHFLPVFQSKAFQGFPFPKEKMSESSISHHKEYITLVSAEGYEFVISKQAAVIAKTIKAMVEACGAGTFDENKHKFEQIGAVVLEMVCRYLSHRHNIGSESAGFPPLESLDPKRDDQLVIELLLAANYLDC
jgi:transcription elongation factor B subunit 1